MHLWIGEIVTYFRELSSGEIHLESAQETWGCEVHGKVEEKILDSLLDLRGQLSEEEGALDTKSGALRLDPVPQTFGKLPESSELLFSYL